MQKMPSVDWYKQSLSGMSLSHAIAQQMLWARIMQNKGGLNRKLSDDLYNAMLICVRWHD
jgi:hypothetical protein